MSNVLNLNKNEYRLSVNTPDYIGREEWLINPDVSSVKDVEAKYWKLKEGTKKTIVPMSLAERKKVDEEERQNKNNQSKEDKRSIWQRLFS